MSAVQTMQKFCRGLVALLVISLLSLTVACSSSPPTVASGDLSESGGVALTEQELGLGGSGFLTSEPPQATAIAGGELLPIVTVGDELCVNPNNPELCTYDPIPDGLGAYREGRNLIVFSNHEISNSGVDTQDGGRGFFNARVSRLKLNARTMGVEEISYPIDGSEGYSRFCSSALLDEAVGFDPPVYATGEESFGGGLGSTSVFVGAGGEVLNGDARCLGLYSHENNFAIPPINGQIVLFSTDDDGGRSEFYMYLADSAEDAIACNGKLYVYTSNEITHSGNMSVGQEVQGRFVEVPNPESLDYDALQEVVDDLGALPFVRLEDGDSDRRPGRRNALWLLDTGRSSVFGREEVGAVCNDGTQACDKYGSIYRMELNRRDPLSATLKLIARGTGGFEEMTSPDNLGCNRRTCMVQEDPAIGDFPLRAPRIYQYPILADGSFGDPTPVVSLNDETCPLGQGCYESSGIISLEEIPGFRRGTWLFDVQAHTLPVDALNLSEEGGQLLMFTQPGS